MSVTRFLRSSALTLAIAAVAAAPLIAQSQGETAVASLKTKLADIDTQAQKLVRELEFTEYKHKSTANKLHQTVRDAEEKESSLQALRASLDDNPSEAELEIIANEEQRIALAAINIKSLTASVERLERKEAELREALATLESEKQNATESIARAQERARAQAVARAKAAEAELAALKEENERLRLAMEEEARRAAAAQAQAATEAPPAGDAGIAASSIPLAAENVAEQMTAAAEETAAESYAAAAIGEAFNSRRYAFDTGDEPNPPAPEPVQAQEASPPAEQVAEEEEPPVYTGDDGPQVVMRSRSIDEPVVMKPIDSNVFEAEVEVEAGRAYFDVRNKRFRGRFPESDQPQTFVFRYDARGEEPSFTVKAKTAESEPQSAEDPQMISDSGSAF